MLCCSPPRWFASWRPSLASVELLEFAGLCWTAAFILFVLLYGPLLAMRSPGWNEARR